MVLVPQLAQAAIRSDCRMFFNKTAQDILKIIFNDAGVTKTAFRLYSQPAQRKATAQFNETSLHFATRLMEEEGWYYFFEHTSDSHTLVVTNDNNGFYTIPGTTLRLGVGTTADMITEYRKPELLAPGKVTVKDYDFDAPDKNLKMEQNTILKHGGISNRPVFHWPALTRDTGMAKNRARWRMEAAEAAVSLIAGGGDNASLIAGGKFKLRTDAGEQIYIVQSITHRAEDVSERAGVVRACALLKQLHWPFPTRCRGASRWRPRVRAWRACTPPRSWRRRARRSTPTTRDASRSASSGTGARTRRPTTANGYVSSSRGPATSGAASSSRASIPRSR